MLFQIILCAGRTYWYSHAAGQEIRKRVLRTRKLGALRFLIFFPISPSACEQYAKWKLAHTLPKKVSCERFNEKSVHFATTTNFWQTFVIDFFLYDNFEWYHPNSIDIQRYLTRIDKILENLENQRSRKSDLLIRAHCRYFRKFWCSVVNRGGGGRGGFHIGSPCIRVISVDCSWEYQKRRGEILQLHESFYSVLVPISFQM